MSDDVWDRHANPWSGWTRLSLPPLFAFAVWSRAWIGTWAVLLVALVVLWTWWNPRAFPKTENTDNWMSKGVFGERIWIAQRADRRNANPIFALPNVLAFFCAVGVAPFAWGLFAFDFWAMATGLTLIVGGKLWFLDRMVLLFEQSTEREASCQQGVDR
ncbi:MAG: DUF6653 family protein [Pseudomonadota bacterium]